MLYTDSEILETIREARMSLCDIIFFLLDSDLKDTEVYEFATIANARLRAASSMCQYNIRKRFPEEYDD